MSKRERSLYSRVASSRTQIRIAYAGLAGAVTFGCTVRDEPEQVSSTAAPSVLVAQTPLDGATVPKYVEPVPTFSGSRANGTATVTVDMVEFQQKILPASMYAGLPAPFNAGTFQWGYKVNGNAPHFPATTIESRQGVATSVIYANRLQGAGGTAPFLQRYLTQDLTIHWADPTHITRNNNCANATVLTAPCTQPSAEPIPTVPHLHGAEVLSAFDGHPDSWFTPNSALTGPGFVSNTYQYVNTQEATTLWFHDHALGTTRLNVYSGMAGFYLIRDARDTGATGNAIGLPAGAFEQELMVADRQFDTNGQLKFPDAESSPGAGDGPTNPDTHPFWIPEFFGDVVTVNGKSWPFLEVEPRRYRLRFVNGSNARFFQMQLVQSSSTHQPTTTPGPHIWQIGSDGGLLNAPADLDSTANPDAPHLFLAPAERGDVIVDFAGQSGKNFILINGQGAFAPFPSGDPPDPNTNGQVMEFRVNRALSSTDTSFNPAAPQRALRAAPIVDIKPADTRRTPDKKRQLILVEVEGDGGPLEVLINNSHWDGLRNGTTTTIPGSVSNGRGISATEVPRVGSTELWEIANLTEDAHPIHIHLIQFQLIERQAFTDPEAYRAAWDGTFPGGTFAGVTYAPGEFIPGFGPPRTYTTPNASGAIGGNIAFDPFVDPAGKTGPAVNETGWKDTLKIPPGQVTRIAVRWAPTTVAVNGVQAGTNTFAFDPTTGGPGYVWHCHILDHEDNEMMRSYLVGR
jgi:FtsP/CotA-like multicopper oxidase with cupredoxin domain